MADENFSPPALIWYASVPTDGSREAYRTGIMAKQRQNSGSLTKTIDRLEWMREQMLTLQRALERVESDKRGRRLTLSSWHGWATKKREESEALDHHGCLACSGRVDLLSEIAMKLI